MSTPKVGDRVKFSADGVSNTGVVLQTGFVYAGNGMRPGYLIQPDPPGPLMVVPGMGGPKRGDTIEVLR